MALQGPQIAWTFPAAGTMASNQYKFGLMNSAGRIDLNAANGGFCTGVIDDNVDAIDKACRTVLCGITKVKCNGVITRGALIMSDATGQAVTATSGGVVLGQALETGAVGNIITVFLFTGGARQ